MRTNIYSFIFGWPTPSQLHWQKHCSMIFPGFPDYYAKKNMKNKGRIKVRIGYEPDVNFWCAVECT